MNWLDYLIICSFCLFAIIGFRRGFVREVISIVAVVLGVLVALKSYPAWTTLLEQKYNVPTPLSSIVAFGGLFLATCCVILVIGHLWKSVTNETPVASLDRLLGAVFGFIKAAFIIGLIMTLLVSVGVPGFQAVIDESYMAPTMIKLFPVISEGIEDIFPVNVREKAPENI